MEPKVVAIVGVIAAAFICGVLLTILNPLTDVDRLALTFLSNVISYFFMFSWMRSDEQNTSFRRSPMFNIGLVAISLFFVPLYLYKSRPRGARLRAMGHLAHLFVLMALSGVAGRLFGVIVTLVTRKVAV